MMMVWSPAGYVAYRSHSMWARAPSNRIRLDGALAHIECERFATYPGGDHTIVIGRVVGGEAHEGRPLLYYRGGYAALG